MIDYHSIALFADEALRRKDPWNHHGLNVSRTTMEMLHLIPHNLSSYDLEMIRYGAWMHDVGKLFLEDELLNLPRRLTQNEKFQMQTHVQTGWEFGSSLGFDQTILNIIFCHHENADGTGYPRGLKNDQIPKEGRIVHMADVFDAMTQDRAYRKAMTHESAFHEMEVTMAGKFDIELLAVLRTVVQSKKVSKI